MTDFARRFSAPRRRRQSPRRRSRCVILSVDFDTRQGPLRAVDGISYRIERGRTLGVVGESGCGKSVSALAVMGLIDPPGEVSADAINLHGTDLSQLPEPTLCALRGAATWL